MKRRAVFLDRDGVINANRPDHVKTWSEFEFLERTPQALSILARLPFAAVVITNQAAIHRHLTTEENVRDIHVRMRAAIERAGGCIDAVYYCPHTPDEKCSCRKPQPGMYLHAAGDLDLNLERSYVIGDARADAEAARAIGARPILVLSGRDCDRRSLGCGDCATNCTVVNDLFDAVEWIRKNEGLAQ